MRRSLRRFSIAITSGNQLLCHCGGLARGTLMMLSSIVLAGPQLTLCVSKVRLRYAEQHHQRSPAQSAHTDL